MNLLENFRFRMVILRSVLGRALLKSSDNLPMFCRNLPMIIKRSAAIVNWTTALNRTIRDIGGYWGRPLVYWLICSNSFNPSSLAIFRPRRTDWLIVGWAKFSWFRDVYLIITFPSVLWDRGNKHKTPQFILAKIGVLLDSIAMGSAP